MARQSHFIDSLKTAYHCFPGGVFIFQNGKPVYANIGAVKIFEFDSVEEILGTNFKLLLSTDSHKQFQKELRELFDEKAISFDLNGKKKSGELFDLKCTISPIEVERTKLQVILVEDITEEKRSLEKIRSSAELFESFFQQSPEALVVVQAGKISISNQAFQKFFLIADGTDLHSTEISGLIDPENQQTFQTICKKILSGKSQQSELIHKAYRGDGSFVDVKTTVNLIHIDREKSLLLSFRDITSEIQEKQALDAKASEWSVIDELVTSLGEIYDLKHLLKSLSEKVTEAIGFSVYAIYLTDSKNENLELQQSRGFASGLTEKLTSLTLEEGIGGFLHKTLEPHVVEIVKYPSYLPFRATFTHAGFSKMCLVPFVNKGKLLGALLLATKNENAISPSMQLLNLLTKHGGEAFARVLTFEKLRKTEKDFRQSIESTTSVLYKLAMNGTFISFNSALERLTGHERKEFFRTTSLWLSLIHPDDKKLLLERQTKLPELTEAYTIEYRVRPRGKAQYRWVRDTLSPVKSADGQIDSFEGTMEDVSDYKQLQVETKKVVEQKQIEQQSTESTQIFHNIINTMEDVLILSSLDGTVLQVNHAFEKKFGYRLNEATTLEFPQPWLSVDQTAKYVLWMSELKKEGTLHDFDMRWKTKSGLLFDMSISTAFITTTKNEPTAILTVARDISERKLLSKELEERNAQLDLLNRIITAAEESMDFDEIFEKIARELKKVISFEDVEISLIADEEYVEMLACEGVTESAKGALIPIEQTITQLTIRGHEPVIIADMTEDEDYARLNSYYYGIRSQMSFPIVLKGRILGTLNIGSTTPNMYRDVETKSLQSVAQQLGVIIDRVQLFNKVSEDSWYISNLLDSIDSVVYTVDRELNILQVNRAWNDFIRAYEKDVENEYEGTNLFDVLPDESLKAMLQKVTEDLLAGSIEFSSGEIVLRSLHGERMYQVTINPLVIEKDIFGLVISHTDITELRQSASELKKHSEKLLALNSIATKIQTSRSIEEILHTAVPMLQKTTEADAIAVYLKSEETDDLFLAAHSEISESLLNQIPNLSLRTSATGNVVKTHQSLFIQQKAYDDSRILKEFRAFFRLAGIEALGIIPLVSRERVYGAIDIVYRTRDAFTDQLCQILALVSNQLGTAIENVQLYNQLQKQVEQLSVLYRISQQLTSTLEMEHIYDIIALHLQQSFSFETLSIGLFDEKTHELVSSFDVSQNEGRMQIFSKASVRNTLLEGTPEHEVIVTKQSVLNSVGNLIHIPMLSKEKIFGIMSLSVSEQAHFSQTQIRLLENIANLVAIALEKAKLHQETIQKSAEIERRNKELDDFAYVVSHDLKEPLISVEGFCNILQSDFSNSISEEGKEYLDSIVSASGRMKGLIDDLLMLSRISRPSDVFKPVNLEEVINEVKADFVYTLTQKNAMLILEDPMPTVFGNRSHLKILFQNLISNALKFNDKERPTVEIGFLNAENNSYLFFVRDNGIGIDKDYYEKIFVIFQRLHPREQYEGSGAGLAIVKKIIEMHKGTIWVESIPGQGTTFYFTLTK
ncbi:MAG: PAS domain S-box protein [Ignavibacteriae bacterium]|nr:PAS domain S-box protein [Ignavibacteriota bacterium]